MMTKREEKGKGGTVMSIVNVVAVHIDNFLGGGLIRKGVTL